MNSQCGEAKTKESTREVYVEFENLKKSIDDAEGIFSKLRERLKPVCKEEPSDLKSDDPVGEKCPFAKEIREAMNKVEDLKQWIRETIDSLQI